MKIIQFVPGTPKGQPRPRAFARKFGNKYAARVFDPGTAECWKSEVAAAMQKHIPETPMVGALNVTLNFVFKRPKAHYRKSGELKPGAPEAHTSKPDADNAAKGVLDSLTAMGLWHDDAQICRLIVTKEYGNKPGCLIVVETIECST